MKIMSCNFNMDTGCVELKFFDGSMLSIDCTGEENEIANNIYQRAEAGLSNLQRSGGICGADTEW